MRDNTLFANRRTARVDLMDTLCCSVSMAACQSVGGFILALLLFHMNEKGLLSFDVMHTNAHKRKILHLFIHAQNPFRAQSNQKTKADKFGFYMESLQCKQTKMGRLRCWLGKQHAKERGKNGQQRVGGEQETTVLEESVQK